MGTGDIVDEEFDAHAFKIGEHLDASPEGPPVVKEYLYGAPKCDPPDNRQPFAEDRCDGAAAVSA